MERSELRQQLLKAALEEVPFDGWSRKAIRRAGRGIGLDEAAIARAFPGGAIEMIEYWNGLEDAAVIVALQNAELASLKIRQRVTLGVRLRIEALTPHREAARRAFTLLLVPARRAIRWRILYRTVDTIWFAIGDRSTDTSFYTKRGLLAAVYLATFLVWLDDTSDGQADTWEFLDRRIDNVMQIPKITARLKAPFANLPNPLDLLRRFRPVT